MLLLPGVLRDSQLIGVFTNIVLSQQGVSGKGLVADKVTTPSITSVGIIFIFSRL